MGRASEPPALEAKAEAAASMGQEALVVKWPVVLPWRGLDPADGWLAGARGVEPTTRPGRAESPVLKFEDDRSPTTIGVRSRP